VNNKTRLVLVIFTFITSIVDTSIVKSQINPEKIKNLELLYKLNGIAPYKRHQLIIRLKKASLTTKDELFKAIIGSFPQSLKAKNSILNITSTINTFWKEVETLSSETRQEKIHDFLITMLLSLLKNTQNHSKSLDNSPATTNKKSKKNKQKALQRQILEELDMMNLSDSYSDEE